MNAYRLRSRALTLAVVLTLWAPCLHPADAVFEHEITVTATGLEAEVDQIPVSVTVVDRTEIEDSQTESTADLLRRIPGLLVTRTGDEGKAASLFSRGTESDHTLVLFDGVRLNSPYFGGYDWSLPLTSGLERIEVTRGPFSALWGADAVGGVVHLVPARGEGGLSGELDAEGGGSGWRRFEGSMQYGNQAFDLYASGSHREGDAELANSDFATTQWLADAGWSMGAGQRLGLLVQQLDASTGIPFTGAVVTPDSRQSSAQTLLAVPLTLRLGDDWSMQLTASQVWRSLEYSNPDDPFGYTRATTDADTSQARVAVNRRLDRHELSIGGEWRRDSVDDVSSFGVNLAGQTSDVDSAFAQDVWRLGDRLRLILGARFDDAEEWGSELSPRVNAGWDLGYGFGLRAGYGEAFRQPSVGELYFPGSGNTDLEAETSRSVELGLTHRSEGRGPRWELTAFGTDLEQLIEFDYLTYRFQNVSQAEIRGGELGASLELGDGLETTAQVTYLETEGEGGQPLLRRPRWSGSWTLRGGPLPRLRGDVTVLWVGPRDDVDPVTFDRLGVGGHVTAHLALAWEASSHGELTLRVVNVADRDYAEVLGYPAPGRRVMVGFRARFE